MTAWTAKEHAVACARLYHSWSKSSGGPGQSRRDAFIARLEAYEAEAHRRIRQDATDASGWLLVRDPGWLGFMQVFVPHGPEPRVITMFWLHDGRTGQAQRATSERGSAALRALGYVIDASKHGYLNPWVRLPDPQSLSVHRRLEGYRRVEEALSKCPT